MDATTTFPCIHDAWRRHEVELRGWLRARLDGDEALAEDFLQNLFLEALRQGKRFCEVEHARAWLFTAARNAIVDHRRVSKRMVPLPDSLPVASDEPLPVDTLASCLPRALSELSDADADILRRCDLEGMAQATYASEHGLTVPGAKSRLQRVFLRRRPGVGNVLAAGLGVVTPFCACSAVRLSTGILLVGFAFNRVL